MRVPTDELCRICEAGRVSIVGVGNRMKGDDGAGPALTDILVGRIDADCVDAGVAPENFLEKIAGPSPATVLFVDAMDFGGRPGETRIVGWNEVNDAALSTHALSLSMAGRYLHARCGSDVYVLGIQPADMALNHPMSRPVAEAVDSLGKLLSELLKPS